MLIVQKVLENATKYVQNAKDKKMSKKRLKFLNSKEKKFIC